MTLGAELLWLAVSLCGLVAALRAYLRPLALSVENRAGRSKQRYALGAWLGSTLVSAGFLWRTLGL